MSEAATVPGASALPGLHVESGTFAVALAATTEPAAARRRVAKHKHQLMLLDPPDPDRLPDAVRDALAACVVAFLEPPARRLGPAARGDRGGRARDGGGDPSGIRLTDRPARASCAGPHTRQPNED